MATKEKKYPVKMPDMTNALDNFHKVTEKRKRTRAVESTHDCYRRELYNWFVENPIRFSGTTRGETLHERSVAIFTLKGELMWMKEHSRH